MAIFLHELAQKNNSILTIVDLGCGNGTNSRIIAKGIFDSLGLGIKVNVVYMDVSSDLLKESDRRSIEFQREYKNFSWELIQIDFNNKNHLSLLAEDYNKIADFVFSIKFLHNTNLKIDKNIANFIASITKSNGIFLNQFYVIVPVRAKIASYIKFFLNKTYGDSVWIDRFFADKNLRANSFEIIYDVIQKSRNSSLKVNHFYEYAIERYYKKIE